MLNTSLLVSLNEWTNHTFVLPVAVFFPTNRCNSRCVSCDWWQSSGDDELTEREIDQLTESLEGLGTRLVLFSGGEPLLRPDVFTIAGLFRQRSITLHLHTSGVLLERFAQQVADTFSRVIVSLDAADEQAYRTIRGVGALRAVERGVASVRALKPTLPVTARSTLHRLNYREVPRLVHHARAMSLDGISFLPADTESTAFGRSRSADASGLALDREQIVECAADFASGFIAESPEKLRRILQHYAARAGLAPYPAVECNAPYMSVVIEADGEVRPCFFHTSLGSIRRSSLATIIERQLPAFRSILSVADNPICRRCVCSMKTGWRSAPWL